MKTKRTIMALAVMKGRVHVYLPNRAIGTRFIQQAEKEGFTFGDGVMPTAPGRGYSMIMGVNHDMTLNYVGIVGRMAFYSGCRKFCGEKYLRVDFSKYINGEKRLLRFLRKFVIRPKVHFFAKIQEIAQPRGFRAFWFKTLKYTCQVFSVT